VKQSTADGEVPVSNLIVRTKMLCSLIFVLYLRNLFGFIIFYALFSNCEIFYLNPAFDRMDERVMIIRKFQLFESVPLSSRSSILGVCAIWNPIIITKVIMI